MTLLGDKGKGVLGSARDVLTIRSVVALTWPLFLFWSAQSDVHLQVWMDDDAIVYPSEATSNLSLPLTFGGDSARSATVVTVRIVNDGKQVIGGADGLWSLSMHALNATHASLIGEVRTKPADVIVDRDASADRRTVALRIGALQPKADIALTLLLVNVADGELPRLELKTSLAGLPRPREIRWSSPEDLLGNRLLPWVALGMFVILLVIRMLELNKTGEWKEKKNLWTFALGQILVFGIGAVIVGAFVTKGLAWLMYRMG